MHLFCLCWFPLIFINTIINLCEKKCRFFVIVAFKNCFSLTGRPISNANLISFGMPVFYFSDLSFIDGDTIENHLHPLYIIVD